MLFFYILAALAIAADAYLTYKHITLKTAFTTLKTDFDSLKSDVDAYITKVKTEVGAAKSADKL
jgi:hypothetical protein